MITEKADKREHIIDTAIDLFSTKGFEGTSIRDLAAAAGVNVAMVNYYFGSKDKLFESIIERKTLTSRDLLDDLVKDESLSEMQKIERYIDLQVDKLFANRKFHRVMQQELMLNQRAILGDAITKMISEKVYILKSIIERGIRKKEFQKVDTMLTICSISGTINQVVLSKRMCKHLLGKDDPAYSPYEDPVFIKRIKEHLKQMMRCHLLNK